MLHYEQVFGNVFEKRESKCRAVLIKHRRKVKGEQVITLQMAQQLKTKNINVLTGKLFCRQCKAKFWWEKDSVYHDKDKFQPVTVIDNGESEWLGYVAQGNAWKIENSIIFRTNPNSYLRTW